MSRPVITPALIETFLNQLKLTLNKEYHVVPNDSYRYKNPSCLRGHISTTNRDLGDPFSEEQINIIKTHLCSFIQYSRLRSMADKAPCMILFGILGLRKIITDRLMAILA